MTSIRAGIIVGHGGISWELTRQLVEHLPVMVTPRWVRTRTQPIAAADVIRYLVGVLTLEDPTSCSYDVGGPEVLEYVEMLRRVASIEGRTPARRPGAAAVAPAVRPVAVAWSPTSTCRRLARSSTRWATRSWSGTTDPRLVPFEPMDYDSAVLAALGERAKAERAGAV